MVKPFQFAAFPRIYFKSGSIEKLPGLIRSFGQNVILVTGKCSFISSSKADALFQKLTNEAIRHQIVIVPGEPSPQLIDECVGKLSNGKFDVVAAIGGGSVLDAGKAISAMMYQNGSVSDFLEGIGTREHPGTKLPFIAVPTTSGTGSEATKNAVISKVGADGFKRSLRHDNFVPDIAVVDPELTMNCPADITAASGMDCFSQLTEAFLSDKSNQFTDAFAREGMKAVKVSLIRAFKDGQDKEAREGMSFAALTSGICLANAGLGAVHGFASSLGGRYSIPHGLICGTLMATSNEITVKKLRKVDPGSPALGKYAEMGELFTGAKSGSDNSLVDGFIEYLHKLTEELRLPGLKEAGVKEEDLEELAANTDCKNNPVKLDRGELLEILRLRYK